MDTPEPRDLPITPEQAALLDTADRAVEHALAERQLLLTMLVAGHGITAGEVVGRGGTPTAPTVRLVIPTRP